jgi:hypothetical protein
MDDQALGGWVLDQARSEGVVIQENCDVDRLRTSGGVCMRSAKTGSVSHHAYTWLVNACGPWTVDVLERSGVPTAARLDLVRGSHLLVPPPPGLALPKHGLIVDCQAASASPSYCPTKESLWWEQRSRPSRRISRCEQARLNRSSCWYWWSLTCPPGCVRHNNGEDGFRACGPSCAELQTSPAPAVRQICSVMVACSPFSAASGPLPFPWLSNWWMAHLSTASPEITHAIH